MEYAGLAVSAIAVVVLAVPLLLAWASSRSSSTLLWRASSLLGAPARIAVRLVEARLEKPEEKRITYPVVLQAIRFSKREDLAWKALEKLGCPSQEVLEEYWRLGLYNTLINAVLDRKCSAPEGLVERIETIAVLLAKYREPPQEITLYCSGDSVEALAWGKTYSSETLDGQAKDLVLAVENGDLHASRGVGLVVQYGCGGGHVDLGQTLLLLLPETGGRLDDAAYHLGLHLDNEASSVELVSGIASKLAWLLTRYHKPGDPIPQSVSGLLALAPGDPIECPQTRGEVLVTDSPRLACPQYTPYKLDIDRLEGLSKWVATLLADRSANPVRAILGLLEAGYTSLADAIVGVLEWDPSVGGDHSYIEPWYLNVYPAAKRLSPDWECRRPRIDCSLWTGPGPVELELAARGVEVPWRASATVDAEAAKKIVSSLGNRTVIRVAGVSEEATSYDGLLAAVKSTLRVLEGEALIVAPNRLLAESLGREGFNTVSWRELELRPWLAGDSKLVIVYPERLPKPLYMARLTLESGYKLLLKLHLARMSELSRKSLLIAPGLASYEGDGARIEFIEPLGSGESLDGKRMNESGRGRTPWLATEGILSEASRVFREKWGARLSLRPHQASSINAILLASSGDPPTPVASIYPTGSGKSAIFQVSGALLAGLYGGYTLVVSPLKALMRDQVESLLRKGFLAVRIDSSQPLWLRRIALSLAVVGAVDYVYATPERFQDDVFAVGVSSYPPSLVVLDEAHTISKWGSSFRPSYLYAARFLGDLYRELRSITITLFTATAGGDLLKQVLSTLGIGEYREVRVDLFEGDPILLDPLREGPLVFRSPTIRRNLYFTVRRYGDTVEERLSAIAREISLLAEKSRRVSDPWLGLVFTSFVKSDKYSWANVEELAEEITRRTGLEAIAYHGQLPPSERRRREDLIYASSSTGVGPRIIVATKAFGMGMDLPNIRFVLHVLPSDSIEDYYQEAGRAGRDGLPSWIVSLYAEHDYDYKRKLLQQQRITPSIVLSALNTLAMLSDEIRRRTGGLPILVVPLSLVQSKTRFLKGVDTLRALGYLDYTVTRARVTAYRVPPTMNPADYLPWYMPLGSTVYLGPRLAQSPPGWEEVGIHFKRCRERLTRPLMEGLRYEAGDVVLDNIGDSECASWEDVPHNLIEGVLLVYPGLERERDFHAKTVLGVEDYAMVTRLGFLDMEKFDSYKRIMGEALEIAESRGDGEADKYLKKRIDQELSNPPRMEPVSAPPPAMNSIVYCPDSFACVLKAIPTIIQASEWLGTPNSVAIATQHEEIAALLSREYARRTGVEPSVIGQGIYRKLLRVSREGPEKLMDLGYIVLLAKADGRIRGLLARLEAYPYKTIYLYAISPGKIS